jgi:PAS domain S-box-containing protein
MMMDQMPQYVFLKDENGIIIYANDNYCKLYNTNIEEIIGRNWQSYQMDAEALEKIYQMDKFVLESNKIFKVNNFRYVDPNGIEHYFDIVKMPFISQFAGIKTILVIMTDNADRVKADHEKSRLLEELVTRNKNLENFSYTISHNLRGPVATLLGLAELIEDPDTAFDDKLYLFREVNALVRRTDQTIRDINDILQIKNSNKGYSNVNLEEVVKDIILSNNPVINHENIEMYWDLEITVLFTVKSFISSIITNLIANAIKYRNKNKNSRIDIRSYYLDKAIVIEVEDNGLGIDLVKHGDNLFKLYKRFHVNAAEGTGVGLYLVKLQVDELMGSIQVESEPNKGTKFIITFNN